MLFNSVSPSYCSNSTANLPPPPSLPYLLSISSQGDTIDDLCRPDLDDKLEELKALSEVRREREKEGEGGMNY